MPDQYLSDPCTIEPYDENGTLQAVIETPKGSRNKYAYDHDRHVLVLKKTLPAGMIFPYDFGFIPSTQTDDGDPMDLLVLMEEPAYPRCVLDVRLIGVVEGEDELPQGKTRRNDRLLAVSTVSHTFENVQSINDLPGQVCTALAEFFVNYPKILSGKHTKFSEYEDLNTRRLLSQTRAAWAADRLRERPNLAAPALPCRTARPPASAPRHPHLPRASA